MAKAPKKAAAKKVVRRKEVPPTTNPTRQACDILMGIQMKSIGVQNALKILQREV